MFNHSARRQNVGWKRNLEAQVVVYTALRDIQEGEELLISYGPHLTFVDVEEAAVTEAREEERAEDVLGAIEVDL
jgi:SET domain-containing protein